MVATSAQKTSLPSSLDEKVFTRVSRLLQARSGRLPATLVKQTDGNGGDGKTGTIWMVNVEQDGTYTLPQIGVPLHGHEFARLPYKQGDKGFLTTADTDTTSMSNLNSQQMASTYARPANLAALVWHPLGNTQFTPQIDANAHESYGRDSGTITHDGSQKSVIRTHKDDGTVMSSGGSGNATSASQADGPHKITAHPTDGTKIETPAAHTLQANNATLDAQGNQSNQGNSTTAQNITSTGGNVSAPSGAMSAPQGSFASGSIGGIGFASGLGGGLLGSITNMLNGLFGGAGGGLTAAALATGAASSNVGALGASGGDVTGSLPDGVQVRGLLNVTRANQLPMYASNVQALNNGLQPGQLYLYNVSGGTYLVAAVV